MTTKIKRLADMRAAYGDRHPGVLDLLTYFSWEHLPVGPLRDMSMRFGRLAGELMNCVPDDSPQLITGLRKLLEAKDCAVRAVLP